MLLAYEFKNRPVVCGFLAIFSGVIKYHSLPIILLNSSLRWILINFEEKFRKWNNINFSMNIFILIGSLIFLIIYHKLFNVWIVPEKHHEALDFSLNTFVNNLFSYGFYLSGMFFITIPAFLKIENIKIKLALLALSIVLAVNNQNLGEMDFGSFSSCRVSYLLIKIIGFWNFLLCLQISER